jgi:hypothetical protein
MYENLRELMICLRDASKYIPLVHDDNGDSKSEKISYIFVLIHIHSYKLKVWVEKKKMRQ